MACIETDILIVGAGPAGASLGCFLTQYGVTGLIISKASSTARTPRAHYTNNAAFECLRDIGLEPECRSVATPKELIKFYRFCHTMAGEEISRSYYAGNDPYREGEYKKATPCEQADIPQSILEPILLRVATQNGFKLRWNYEFLTCWQNTETGKVHSTIKDLLSGQELTIVSNYLCGADGARSVVARELDLPFQGKLGGGLAVNVWFEADLSHLMAHSPGLIHMLIKPDKPQPDYCALAITRQVRPFNEWVVSMLAKPGVTEVTASQDEMLEHVRDLIGDDTVSIKPKGFSYWSIQDTYAEKYSSGNVFCLGDAVHRHPPFNGLGSNTCIQDAYNLAWKIAYVRKGLASPSLLQSYNDERQPVGKAVVTRTNETGKIHAQLFALMGVFEPDLTEKRKILNRLEEDSDEGAEARAAFQKIIEKLDSERHGFGIEMNQLYTSNAVWSDDEPGLPPSFSDPEDEKLHYLERTYPGFRLPHAWLRASKATPNDPMISTHDLAGKGHFTIFTGIGGKARWVSAADKVRKAMSVEIKVYSIGGEDYRDLFYDWSKKRGVGEKGAVLVRPDRFVAWRHDNGEQDAEGCGDKLVEVLARILDRCCVSICE
ncbi:FAD binding domain-containing protein [Astrocystis sublimbata]|nr:FAD binding domain-containing protein [Astrocystis sublimbata]